MSLIRVLREYGHLHCAKEPVELADDELPASGFEQLQELAISDDLLSKAFTAGRVKGRGFSVRATSYVGLVQLPDGTQLEILPKLSLGETDEEARKVLLKMLAVVYQLPTDPQRNAVVAQERVSLLEYFIPPFLDEVELLLRRGLRSQYERVQENEQFLRGKLLLPEQLRFNTVNRTKFYCEYDVFSLNRPENRLLHSALAMLYRLSRLAFNKKRCFRLLQEFLHIPMSDDARADLAAWDLSHENRYYLPLLSWCRMLIGLNPTLKSGQQRSFSLLFPMEDLFESYVAIVLERKVAIVLERKFAQQQAVQLVSQSRRSFGNWLNKDGSAIPDDAFTLKPDLLLQSGDVNQLIMDTKWKKVEIKSVGYNISAADLYQMFAYVQYFEPQSGLAFLIYPKTGDFNKAIGMNLAGAEGVKYFIYAVPFDLQNDVFLMDGVLDPKFDPANESTVSIFKRIIKCLDSC